MKTTTACGVLLAALMITAGILTTGCEPTQDGSESIILSPASTNILVEQTVLLTASSASTNVGEDLLLPLRWSLEDGVLGRIQAVGGKTAIYEAFGSPGNNAVIVRDQLDRRGVAAITQSLPISTNAVSTNGASGSATNGLVVP